MRATVPSRRLGARLSRYRNERGHSGAELAAQLGIGQPQLSRIENGKAKVTPATLARLVELLGIPEADATKLDELRRHSTEPGWCRTTATSSASQWKCSSNWRYTRPGAAATKAT
jgi:transcriptional regulator with XRE-family HTH domain